MRRRIGNIVRWVKGRKMKYFFKNATVVLSILLIIVSVSLIKVKRENEYLRGEVGGWKGKAMRSLSLVTQCIDVTERWKALAEGK